MLLPEGQRSSEWVVWMAAVVSALNGEVTRLIWKIPAAAIKQEAVYSKPSTPSTDLLACANNGPPPPPLCTFFTNPASFKAEGKEPQTRYGLWKYITSKKQSPNPMNLFCIICTTGQAWLRSQGTSCRACRHRAAVPALKMIYSVANAPAII